MSRKWLLRSAPVALAILLLALLPAGAFAQTTGGNLEGKAMQADAAVPGVTVTATNTDTGLTRTATTGADGGYRFAALPAGPYSVTFSLDGFNEIKVDGAVVNVGNSTAVDAAMQVASVAETITVTAEVPLIPAEPSIGTSISQTELENLPLNGRQFANVAVLAPGTSLSYNSDPTKPGQLTVLLNGGNGRNVNFTVDGGDNTDDTIGGALQNFNLDAVQEFKIQTSQYKAEYGRSSGGVISVVTKTGTNDFAATLYDYSRDDSLTSRSETERQTGADKTEYTRDQYGISLGGPIVRDRAHFFATYDKLEEEKSYTINTRGIFPTLDGSQHPTPFEDELIAAKATVDLGATQLLSVRYGYQKNSQKYGASPLTTPDALGTLANEYESILGGFTSVINANAVNEFFFQYSNFDNLISADSNNPALVFPGGAKSGQNANTPQTTYQTKYQYKDDLSLSTTLGGDRHDFKFGVNYIDEPDLGGSFTTGTAGTYNLYTQNALGPVREITQNGGFAGFSTPVKQLGGYVQDDWYITERLTLYIGARYDVWDGFEIDQRSSPIWQALHSQTRFTEQYLLDFRNDDGVNDQDDDNIAPRLGFSWDIKGDSRHIIRGGYGSFYDFPYTNATILFPSVAVQSDFGTFYHLLDASGTGIRNPDGTLFRVGQPLPPGESLGANPPTDVASPTLATPYSDQLSAGYSWQVNNWLGLSFEAITIDYHDLPFRFRANGRLDSAGNQLGAARFPLGNFRIWYGGGRGSYDGGNVGIRIRREKFELQGFYTLSETEGNTLAGADEFRVTDRINQPDYHNARSDGLQDFRDPNCGACYGPYYTDSKHKANLAGIYRAPWDINISGFLRYKSATPYTVLNSEGAGGANRDINGDGFSNDLAPGVGSVQSERGEEFVQFDLGASKRFNIGQNFGIEAIAQLFNVFDDENPAVFDKNGAPHAYAGDLYQGEQQMVQLGLKLSWR